jgi:ferredoxin
MPTTIYYFTGTGNSLAVARQLAAELPETTLVPIPKALASGEPIRAPRGTVGFVFPVYVLGLPVIVARFAESVDLSDAEYIFCACTLAECGMTGAFLELEKILRRKQKVPDAEFGIFMPQSYVHGPEGPDEAAKQEIFRDAARKVSAIAVQIRQRIRGRDEENRWKVRLLRLARPFFFFWLHGSGQGSFSLTENCSGCTTCEKVCPEGNITMENKRPVWHDSCGMCGACVNFCPKKAIRVGTKPQRHYRNPEILVRDMMEQHGRKPDLSSLKNR